MDVTIKLKEIEFFLLILIRISGFIITAPFFNVPSVPRKVKAGLSFFIALILFQIIPHQPLQYNGIWGYGGLILEETLVGIIMGFAANICTNILYFAGQIMDMEIGFSMVNELNPVSRIQSTITSNFYYYSVMLMLLVTNMHHYIIGAFVDAFRVIPVGEAIIRPNLYEIFVKFMGNFFIIGFRIVLPIFAATLIVNVILAILAKVAPQINMFVIGLQLKIFVGLGVMFLIVSLMPAVSDFIFNEIKTMLRLVIKGMS